MLVYQAEVMKLDSKEGASYLLPGVLSQSPAYSTEEHMEAYMKADEILRNHMFQLDYAKQQALMSALESLMLQSEAHRASMSAGDSSELHSNGSKEELSDKSIKKSCESSSGVLPWSFTDPSRMPQFAVGVSTIAPSPEKQPSTEIGQPLVQTLPNLDKSQLAALQTQMLATLEHSDLHSQSNCSSQSMYDTPGRHNDVVCTPEKTTVDTLKSPIYQNAYRSSPVVTPPIHSPTTATTSQQQTPVIQEYKVPHNSPNVSSDRLPSANTIMLGQNVAHQQQYFQPVYTQNSSNLHVTDDSVQQVPSPFLLDSNFQLDIPPPNDLIPEHVSIKLYIYLHVIFPYCILHLTASWKVPAL